MCVHVVVRYYGVKMSVLGMCVCVTQSLVCKGVSLCTVYALCV